ncbi:lycopene cyclase family protein [Lunatibacter salilacus]|uniref:lycopene cyclase family protein n=1 Tax=Lunatibacter salilacus TaxID=2483804 RepID=UPI00131CCDDB|nr:lycopene cyclase family protein [Lunatibacter salilacus]
MDYDIVVTGLGCAGLSFVYHLLNSPLKNQKILLIDNDPKQQNDRTWCYWSEDPLEIHPRTGPVIYWDKMSITNGLHSVDKSLGNLKYYQIKSSDFYNHVLAKIRVQKNITWILDAVIDIPIINGAPVVRTGNHGVIRGTKIFNSIPLSSKSTKRYLKQVFVGWEIESKNPCFDPKTVTLMDFDSLIDTETAFVYILPFSEKRGLVEYTIFTKETNIDKTQLEAKLSSYIKNKLGVEDYKINFREEGAIPMSTKNNYNQLDHSDLILLGSIAGCTKPSTGYTFHTIQKHSKKVVNSLVNKSPSKNLKWKRKFRFSFYDNILLNIACKWPNELPHLFQDLFQKNKGRDILLFLNEETSFLQELSILIRLKFEVFIKSLLNYESH